MNICPLCHPFCLMATLLCCFPHVLLAQQPAGGNRSIPLSERPKIGTISGQVVDARTGQALPYATISLLAKPDSALAAGVLADEQGFFELKQVPVGRFWLKMSALGYRPLIKDSVIIFPGKPELFLGKIKLGSATQSLKEVEIVAEQDVLVQNIDKRVFNVDKSIVTEGGSATDVMQQVPGVTVDADGGVSLRGSSNVNILIDGKPSTLTGGSRQAILDQLPASAIERIEIITNPSARYDADGDAGIINIILKKSNKPGINGSLSANAGTREKYNTSANLMVTTQKWSLNAGYNYRADYRYRRGFQNRDNFFNDTVFSLNNISDFLNRNDGHVGRLTLDYRYSKTLTLSAGANGNWRTNSSDGHNRYDYLNNSGERYGSSYRGTQIIGDGSTYEAFAGMKKKLTKLGGEWTADVNYSAYNGWDSSSFQHYFNNVPGILRDFQNTITNNQTDVSTYQTDLFITQGKWQYEGGLKYIHRIIDNDFVSEIRDPQQLIFIPDVGLTNRFVFTEDIASAYGIVAAKWEKWAFQAGLRAEQTFTKSDLKTTDAVYRYNYFGLFPSGHFLRKFGKKQEYRFSYSRRINRPNTRNLNPFPDFDDPFNLMQGNPLLRPEFINSYEASYSFKGAKWNVLGSLFYRQVDGISQRIRTVNEEGIAITTFANLANSKAYGSEITAKVQPVSWLDITANGNLNYTRVSGRFENIDLSNENWVGFAKLIANFNLGQQSSLQVSSNYMGPMVFAQGRSIAVWFTDIGFRKNFKKQNLTLSFNIQDIFDQREWGVFAFGPNFESESLRKRESRVATLGLTWRFGKNEMPARRSKQNRSNAESDDSAPMQNMDW